MKRTEFLVVIGLLLLSSCVDSPSKGTRMTCGNSVPQKTYDNSNSKSDCILLSSQNVTIYDSIGNWYATGLLVESSSKVSLRIESTNYDLVTSDKDVFRYKVKDQGLYVK